MTPVTGPAPTAAPPLPFVTATARITSTSAVPDPAPTPSERVLAASATLTAGLIPVARRDSAVHRSARPCPAQTPASSSDSDPPTPMNVQGDKCCAAGDKVRALKLEPPA
jgi:hypothetical protein